VALVGGAEGGVAVVGVAAEAGGGGFGDEFVGVGTVAVHGGGVGGDGEQGAVHRELRRRGDRGGLDVFGGAYGGPTLVPACGGALVSFHGAPRLDHDDRCGRPVPLGRATRLLRAATVVPGLADHTADALAYTCVKTEWADEHADRWGSRPEHAVIDHAAHGLRGLLSVIPGKMTLAFQATRELAQLVLGQPVPLAPPRPRLSTALTDGAAAHVAVEPWRVATSAVRASRTPTSDRSR
jgi:hypothetical protein